MRYKIDKLITDQIKEKIRESDLKKETFSAEYCVLTQATAQIDGKKIKLQPVSFGCYLQQIEGELIKKENPLPDIAFENFKGKTVYIPELKDLSLIHHIKKTSPSALITNTPVRKPVFIEEFPILHIPSILNQNRIKLNIKTKKIKKDFNNYYFDIGVGAYFLYINFPFDSRFDNPDSIYFYSSFQVLKNLVEKFLKVKHPKGYRIRVILSDLRFSDYLGLKKHLEKMDPDRILSVINLENCGSGNEKLVIKNRKNILDSYHYTKITKIFRKLSKELQAEKLTDYSKIEDINLPVIWFHSQPNENIYSLKKEFLNEKLILNFVNDLFFIINNLYKEN